MEWLEIRNTNVSVLDVLELLSKGNGTEAVLRQLPGLVAADVAYSAAMALRIIIHHWAQCRMPESVLFEDRRTVTEYPRLVGWNENEKLELLKLLENGATVEQLARIFLTMSSEISAVLEKTDSL
ncbi:MAG: hypothetical protein JSU74_03510 [Candidatus Zixiibacteriota bacterium]|nr:MAG: hypothetical protein JSU74_03510 [candidate division Zixibacteria bacterium]